MANTLFGRRFPTTGRGRSGRTAVEEAPREAGLAPAEDVTSTTYSLATLTYSALALQMPVAMSDVVPMHVAADRLRAAVPTGPVGGWSATRPAPAPVSEPLYQPIAAAPVAADIASSSPSVPAPRGPQAAAAAGATDHVVPVDAFADFNNYDAPEDEGSVFEVVEPESQPLVLPPLSASAIVPAASTDDDGEAARGVSADVDTFDLLREMSDLDDL